jgi:hypothetical protein
MPVEFHAELDPSKGLFEEMVTLAPENPFYTAAYAEARRIGGEQVWVFALREGDRLLSACTGFLKLGRKSRWFEIPSLPALGANERDFWEGLLKFCRRSWVSNLEVNTFASVSVQIPANPVPTGRIDRTEYLIDLRQGDLWRPVRKGHRWSINRARKAGLQLRCTTSAEQCRIHGQMMAASMQRRNERGDRVSTDIHVESFLAFLRTGAGILFQAVLEGEVLSSALILLSDSGAYYQTAGTSPEGIDLGASPFLVYETARHLQERRLEVFNLGGVSEINAGLHGFKTGFGPQERSLAAAEYDLRTNLQRALEGPIRTLRRMLAGWHNAKRLDVGPACVS